MDNSSDMMSDHGGSSIGGDKHPRDDDSDNEDNTAQTSKSRGAVTVQIFIKKTYKMINDSDPAIAAWTPEGDKFVIKDPDRFANEVIPQYFDHNKFSSFTRQLNFYKFTREQSKVIKKSDNCSEIAKHQTFYHKYFQKGRPDLLRHLQRSKKTELHEEGSMPFKRPKLAAPSSGRHEDQSLQEQVLKLMQKSQNMEQKVHALEQENNKLSLSVQTLQHQDELKQRAILQCEEHIRRLELQLTNVFQQHINQMQQMNQPLPFGRESSLSAVNPSSLMRYLSFNGSQGLGSSFSQELTRDLSRGISRITTPPRVGAGPGLSRLTTPPRTQLGAAAAAESLVANEMATAANGYGGEPTLGRDNRFKQFLAPGTSEGGAGGNSGPSLPRHPGIKRFGESLDGGTGNASGGATGGGATLPRHPGIKHFSGGPAPAGSFPNGIPTGFNNNLAGNSGNNGNNSNGQNQNGNGNTNNNGGTDSFANAVTREESFGISSLLDLSRGSSLPV